MGFLDQLWDETVAGPAPDSGLGRLRKFNSFSGRHVSAAAAAAASPVSTFGGRPASATAAAAYDQIPVSRSISILRHSESFSPTAAGRHVTESGGGSAPGSPASAASTPTSSPRSPSSPRMINKKLARGKSTPSGYDWIVLSALDR